MKAKVFISNMKSFYFEHHKMLPKVADLTSDRVHDFVKVKAWKLKGLIFQIASF